MVVGGLEAPRRAGTRRARRADPAAAPVEVTRATVIDAVALDGEEAAEAWLRDAAGAGAERIVGAARAVLEQVLHVHRVATADPREAWTPAPSVTRVGYGAGEDVADGRWLAARELPQRRPGIPRERALRPQERFAALLAGRDAALACELLALRARMDLDQGRPREAALQLEAALAAAVEELAGWRELADLAARMDELRGYHPAVARAAAAARAGTLTENDAAAIEAALGRVEAALRARTAGAAF